MWERETRSLPQNFLEPQWLNHHPTATPTPALTLLGGGGRGEHCDRVW